MKPATSKLASRPSASPDFSPERATTTRRAAGTNIPEPSPSRSRAPMNSQSCDASPNQSIPTAATASPTRSSRRV